MVSSTEATVKDPNKSICRDVTRVRLQRVVNGYSCKTGSSVKNVEGLGGGFAYFTMTRIPPESIRINIRHDQVWLALQLIHSDVVSSYNESADIQVVETLVGDIICYVINVNDETVKKLKSLVNKHSNVVCYTWQPGLVEQYVFSLSISLEKIPDFIVHRFGGGE